ncbi:hypothetical protein [Streptomyces sp. NPDC020742]|uniref:hypothetical protein n=1 Tax=Streptomyces sp. NPDC020742 TaxID=3154897 RepID=UPI0033CAFC1D
MATARSGNGRTRNRGSAVPFRLLWLATLLLGVLLAHGARAESAEGHLVSSLPAAAAAPAATGHGATDATAVKSRALHAKGLDPRGMDSRAAAPAAGGPLVPDDSGCAGHPDRSPSHSHELCVSAPPQQGGALAAPCVRAVPGGALRPTPSSVRCGSAVGAAAVRPPLHSATGSPVQQV